MSGHLPGITYAGPAGWGDVATAVLQGATAIGLIDGRFEDMRAVWHKEILFALSSGVQVAGAASMGALRAAECAAFGMIGIGEIFRQYASGKLADDADVAQIHGPAEMHYVPLSEPWVNIEPTFRKMASVGTITSNELERLLCTARVTHFKDRTYSTILENAQTFSTSRREALETWLAVHAVDQKRQDALELVAWLQSCSEQRNAETEWSFSETSQWRIFLSDLANDIDRV